MKNVWKAFLNRSSLLKDLLLSKIVLANMTSNGFCIPSRNLSLSITCPYMVVIAQRTIIYQSYWSASKRSSKSLFKSSVFCLYRTQTSSCFTLQHLPHAKHSFCVPLNLVNKQNTYQKFLTIKKGSICLGSSILVVFLNVANYKIAGSHLYTFLYSCLTVNYL